MVRILSVTCFNKGTLDEHYCFNVVSELQIGNHLGNKIEKYQYEYHLKTAIIENKYHIFNWTQIDNQLKDFLKVDNNNFKYSRRMYDHILDNGLILECPLATIVWVTNIYFRKKIINNLLNEKR